MATEWYVKVEEEVRGPYDSKTVKRLAASGELSAGDEIRKGAEGKWMKTSRVRGLRFDKKSCESSEKSGPPALPAEHHGLSTSKSAVANSASRCLLLAISCLREVRQTTVVTWHQAIRMLKWVGARWNLWVANRRLSDAKVHLGERFLVNDLGNTNLRQELLKFDERIHAPNTNWLLRWQLRRKRRQGMITLIDQANEGGADPPERSQLHERYDTARADKDSAQKMEEALRHKLWPESSSERSRIFVGAGSMAMVAFVVLTISVVGRGGATRDGDNRVANANRAEVHALLKDAENLIPREAEQLSGDALDLLTNICILQVELQADATPSSLRVLMQQAQDHKHDPVVSIPTSRLLRKVAETTARQREIERAVDIANHIPVDDERAIAMSMIGEEASGHGQTKLARRVLENASILVQSSTDLARFYFCRAAVRSDMPDLADSSIRSLPRPLRDEIELEKILTNIQAYNEAEVLAAVRGLAFDDHRDRVRSKAIAELSAQGNASEAFRICRLIETPETRARAAALVAYGYQAEGNFEKALLTFFEAKVLASDLPDGYLRAQHLVTVGEVEAQAGYHRYCKRTFRRASEIAFSEKEHYRPPACIVLSRMAIVLAHQRNLGSAEEILKLAQELLAKSSNGHEGYYDACRAVAAAILKVRGLEEARDWLDENEDELSQAARLLGFAEALSYEQIDDLSIWRGWPDAALAANDLTGLPRKAEILPIDEWTTVSAIADSISRVVFSVPAISDPSEQRFRYIGHPSFFISEVENGIAVHFKPSDRGWLA